MSDMDIIYDRVVAEEKLKAGTKYERLTAMVYKILDTNSVVIHNLILQGEGKSAKHQIDILIERNGIKKKILIECKDYDKKVGIGTIRDFYGAVSQIKPDEAYVVTTTGFTRPARNFAQDEGIALYILRPVSDLDLEERIQSIDFRIFTLSHSLVSLIVDDINERNKLQLLNKQLQELDFAIIDPQGNRISSVYTEINRIIKNNQDGQSKNFREKIIVKPNYIDFYGVKADGVEVLIFIQQVVDKRIEPEGIATLIIESLNGNISKIIQDTDIEKWTFDDEGEVSDKN